MAYAIVQEELMIFGYVKKQGRIHDIAAPNWHKAIQIWSNFAADIVAFYSQYLQLGQLQQNTLQRINDFRKELLQGKLEGRWRQLYHSKLRFPV